VNHFMAKGLAARVQEMLAEQPKRKPAAEGIPQRCEPYLDWIRQMPCLVYGKSPCSGITTAHHVRRFGEKKQDGRAVPLCTT
jgi:hypothetical protein